MATKLNRAARRQQLPYLQPHNPHDPISQDNVNIKRLCIVSTYQGICEKVGISITVQALYQRCKAGTIPCIYIEKTPYIILYDEVEKVQAAANNPIPPNPHGCSNVVYPCTFGPCSDHYPKK